MAPRLPRSFLYVPANRPELFTKAAAGPVDATILDLEDAVPVAEKSTARAAVADWLSDRDATHGRPQNWVRIDPDSAAADLLAVVAEGLDGIFLAKCTARTLAEAVGVLEQLEAGPRAVPVVGLIESGEGLEDLAQMARHPRLSTFGIGEVDLLGDLRMSRTDSTVGAIDGLRMQVVVACAAAGIAAPVAPTSTDFRDLEAFRRTTRHLADLGFRSRTAIHPGQVSVIHEVLTPSEQEVARAQDVLDRFVAAGQGVTTDATGRLIDAAVVRGAQEIMNLRDAASHR